MKEKWVVDHTAYSKAKFGMSRVVLGLAGEFRSEGIAVNVLWPRTAIATLAVRNLLGGDAVMRASRRIRPVPRRSNAGSGSRLLRARRLRRPSAARSPERVGARNVCLFRQPAISRRTNVET